MKLFNWKYKYFRKKLRGVDCMIEDLLFKRYKTLYTREQIRREYDNFRSRQEILKTKIDTEGQSGKLKDTDLGEFKRLEDDMVRLQRDIDRKVEQMKQLDIDVNGSAPTAEIPEGHQGINQTLDALRELRAVTEDYANKL